MQSIPEKIGVFIIIGLGIIAYILVKVLMKIGLAVQLEAFGVPRLGAVIIGFVLIAVLFGGLSAGFQALRSVKKDI